MNAKKIKDVLRQELEAIKPSEEELSEIDKKVAETAKILEKNLKTARIKAEVFIGGSFAKNTLIRKKKYDVDIFVRFDKKYKDEEISNILAKAVPKNSSRIHGSRDYFSFSGPEGVEFEIIPTIKINKPEDARNITDLSFFHVKYAEKKLKKNKKLVDDIRLAKAFAYFQECYGAESYINGFSGYAVELLVIHYKGFINFIKAMAAADIIKQKLILDPEKLYKNKQQIERELNESKLNSPVVLIDPTFKARNALAALSPETFAGFQAACRKFLSKPSAEFFRLKDKEKIFREKYRNNLIEIHISTERQAGDIAGTKLKKFYGFFIQEISRYFEVEKSDFEYDESENIGRIFLAVKQKKQILFSGPPIKMKEALAKFKKEHKKISIKSGKAYAFEKSLNFKEFLNNLENEHSKILEDMSVSRIDIA